METKVSVFIATSLDGYIARPNGDLDWLDTANAAVPDGEDCGYDVLISTGPVASDLSLTCVGASAYKFGFVQLKYAVPR